MSRGRSVALANQDAVRRVYAYAAHRVGPGAHAEQLTREFLAENTDLVRTNISLISSLREKVDERFGPSRRDCELVALHLAGLDVSDIAALLGFRSEAAAVALRRALTRFEGGRCEPPPELVGELVDESAVTAKGPSRRGRRMLKGAVSLAALIATVPAFGALVGDHTTDPVLEPVSRSQVVGTLPAAPRESRPPAPQPRLDKPKPPPPTTKRAAIPAAAPKVAIRQDDARAPQPAPQPAARCGRLQARTKALRVQHPRAQAKLLERQIREKVDAFTRLRGRYPEARFARKVLRERTALERRLYAEWKALLERQGREAKELEAARKACLG